MTVPTKAHENDACFDLYADLGPIVEKVEKQKYVKEFYSMLREDFKGMENNNYDDIERNRTSNPRYN